MSRPLIGLALGSGSARGWSHIGVIEALLDAGIEPDIVCGSSMGSFVGAAFIAGKISELRLWAEGVNWRQVFRLMDLRPLRGGLTDGRQIVDLLLRLDVTGSIEDYDKPFAAVATDLMTGGECVLAAGPIETAVRASVALPGIFSPAMVDGRWLLDGGLVNPVPVSVCRKLGADIVIAVNLNDERIGRRLRRANAVAEKTDAERREKFDRVRRQMPAALRRPADMLAARILQPGSAVPGYFDVIANSINIMQAQITARRLAEEKPDIVLSPNLHDIGLLDFNRAHDAIEAGRTSVKRVLPQIRKLC